MIEVKITEDMIKYAEKRIKNSPDYNNSKTEQRGKIYGFLGEVLVSTFFGVPICDHFDYDLKVFGKKVEVKTVSCSTIPKEDYVCEVLENNISQNCDYYFFCRVMKDLSKGWLLGYFEKNAFFHVAKLVKEGEEIRSGVKAKYNSYVLPIKDLYHFKVDK